MRPRQFPSAPNASVAPYIPRSDKLDASAGRSRAIVDRQVPGDTRPQSTLQPISHANPPPRPARRDTQPFSLVENSNYPSHRDETSNDLEKSPSVRAQPELGEGTGTVSTALGLELMDEKTSRSRHSKSHPKQRKDLSKTYAPPPIPTPISPVSALADISQPPSPSRSTYSLPDLLPPKHGHSQSQFLNPDTASAQIGRTGAITTPLDRPHTAPSTCSQDSGNSSQKRLSTRLQSHRAKVAHDILDEMPELTEADDILGDMVGDRTPGVIATSLGQGISSANYSSVSLASKKKSDRLLGLDPRAKLASFYLLSGLSRVSDTL